MWKFSLPILMKFYCRTFITHKNSAKQGKLLRILREIAGEAHFNFTSTIQFTF